MPTTAATTCDWDKMIADMEGAGYKTVQAVMKETAIALGIIDG